MRQLVLSETLTMGIEGVEVSARVALACGGGAVADSSWRAVSTGAGVSTSVTSGTTVSSTRASTVPAMAVSANPAGTSVGLAVERLHASEEAASVAVKAARVTPDLFTGDARKIRACAQSTLTELIENRRT